MQVDAKFTFWFGVLTNVLILIAGYGVQQAPPIIAQYAPDVQWFAGLAAQINGVVLTALTGIASSKAGPLTSATLPTGTKAVLAWLLLPLFILFVLFGTPARAQNGSTTPATAVANLIKNINNIALADLQNAQALANAMPNKVTAPCWTAVVNMVQKQQAVLNPPASTTGGTTPPLPPVHVFTDAEKVSELIQSLQTGGDIQINCAAMADASKKSVLQIVSAIISGASVAPLVPIVP